MMVNPTFHPMIVNMLFENFHPFHVKVPVSDENLSTISLFEKFSHFSYSYRPSLRCGRSCHLGNVHHRFSHPPFWVTGGVSLKYCRQSREIRPAGHSELTVVVDPLEFPSIQVFYMRYFGQALHSICVHFAGLSARSVRSGDLSSDQKVINITRLVISSKSDQRIGVIGT
jgi:hypothetical protein